MIASDLDCFFRQQLDPRAHWQAGFSSRDPSDRAAFDAHWARILAMPTVLVRAIETDAGVAGYVASFLRDGVREVSYWIGSAFAGRGIATAALAAFLRVDAHRPLHARVADDHEASRRVLEKCGFLRVGHERAFADARQREIGEFVYRLDASRDE